LLAAGLTLLAFAFQGPRGLYDPDEDCYVNVAVNMLDSGDYLVPRLDAGHPNYTTPPLTYWLLAASIQLFGRNQPCCHWLQLPRSRFAPVARSRCARGRRCQASRRLSSLQRAGSRWLQHGTPH
jgi:hypothetical protein